MTHSPPEPRPIPVPDDFQFEWDNPADSHLPFTQDKQHMASPMTPFSGWMHQNYWAAGASLGIGALKQPLMADVRRIAKELLLRMSAGRTNYQFSICRWDDIVPNAW